MDSKSQTKLRQQLKKWRDDLVNLSRTNRLLYFRHTNTASLEIESPGSDAIASRLNGPPSSNFWTFYFPPPPPEDPKIPAPEPSPRPGELLVKDKSATELSSALRLLERKANQEFVDRASGRCTWGSAPWSGSIPMTRRRCRAHSCWSP